jgi:hypothetical protein
MKKLLPIFLAALMRPLVFFANAKDEMLDVVFANEAKLEGDSIMLAPYGDFRHPQGLQRFTREDATHLVNEFNSLLNVPSRMLGLPVYIGHPDHEKFKDVYKDRSAYGRVKKLEAREEGLFANVKWNERGKKLIENEEFSCPSVNWGMVKRSDAWHPVRLKSIGLTNEPNLPVPAITLANEETKIMDRNKLIKHYGLAADATDEQIEQAMANERQSLTTAQTTLATEKKARETAETTLANEKTARQTAETNFANERKARAAILIAAGISAGKILPAEKAQWETDFANEFETARTKLESANAKIKTKAKSDGLGQRNSNGAERQTQIQDFVNERTTKFGEDYTTAFAKCMKAKPELFVVNENHAD